MYKEERGCRGEKKYIKKLANFPCCCLLPPCSNSKASRGENWREKSLKVRRKCEVMMKDCDHRSYQQLGGSFSSGVAKPIFFESSTNIKRREGESQPLKWKNFFQKEVFMKLWQVFLLLKLFFDVLRPGLFPECEATKLTHCCIEKPILPNLIPYNFQTFHWNAKQCPTVLSNRLSIFSIQKLGLNYC